MRESQMKGMLRQDNSSIFKSEVLMASEATIALASCQDPVVL